jgi:hypothetical protein
MSRYWRLKIEGEVFSTRLRSPIAAATYWFVTSNTRGTLFRQAITR